MLRRRPFGWLPILVQVSYLVFSVGDLPAQIASPSREVYYPGTDWRTSTPEAQGLDSSALAAMFDEIQARKIEAHSVLVIRHGYLVLEAYADPFNRTERHALNSATKSFASALVGIALRQGYIKNLDQKMVDFFPDRTIANLDDAKRSITLEHLLTMTSGVSIDNLGRIFRTYFESQDWTEFYLNRPLMSPPGSQFYYDNGGVNLLTTILQKASGQPVSDFATRYLFDPIGISGFTWSVDRQGSNMGYRGLALTPLDMARLGYLYLHGGVWGGQNIVPADYVQASFTNHLIGRMTHGVDLSGDSGYGYLWWGLPFGGWAASGGRGQVIMVLPKQDIVIVFSGDIDEDLHAGLELDDVTFGLAGKYIVKVAADKPLPDNPVGRKSLAAAMESFKKGDQVVAFPAPQITQKVSGKVFHLETNRFGIRTISLECTDSKDCWWEETGDRGVSPKMRFSISGAYQRRMNGAWPVLVRGHWSDENTLIVDSFNQAHEQGKETVIFQFEDEDNLSVMFSAPGLMHDHPVLIHGKAES